MILLNVILIVLFLLMMYVGGVIKLLWNVIFGDELIIVV